MKRLVRNLAVKGLFLTATLLPTSVLGWLGARLIGQDADVERQRQHEGLELAANRLALNIDRKLTEIEDRAAGGFGIRFTAEGPDDSTLLYRVTSLPSPE